MVEAYVDHLAFTLGDQMQTVEESVDLGRTLSGAREFREAGFARHHVCSTQVSAYDLARQTAEKIRGHLTGAGTIIYATCLPANGSLGDQQRFFESRDVKHLMDFPASHLQADLGLDNATVIGLNQQACTGMLGSLRLARSLIIAEPDIERVLCITADRFPEGAVYEQAYNLISDGAAACVVSRVPAGFRLIACHGITNGALARADDDETAGSFFAYAYRVIHETLAKAAIALSDIDWIVAQNTNIKAWQILAGLLRYDLGRVYCSTMKETGHVISGDNIINLHALVEEGGVRGGERLMLFMAGYGLNWQCVILERVGHG